MIENYTDIEMFIYKLIQYSAMLWPKADHRGSYQFLGQSNQPHESLETKLGIVSIQNDILCKNPPRDKKFYLHLVK